MRSKRLVGLFSTLLFLVGLQTQASAGFWEGVKDFFDIKSNDERENCLRYFKRGDYVWADSYCRIAMEKDENFAYYAAMIAYYRGNNEDAFRYLKKAMEVLQNKQGIEEKKKLVRVYFYLGTLYDKEGGESIGEALNYYKKAIALAEEVNEKYILARAALRLGATYLYWQIFDKAEEYLMKSLKAIEEAKEEEEISKKEINSKKAEIYKTVAILLYKKKDYKAGEEYFMKAFDVIKGCCREELADYEYDYGYAKYFIFKDYEAAEKYIKSAIERAKKEVFGDMLESKNKDYGKLYSTVFQKRERIEEIGEWYETLAKISIERNDKQRAKDYLNAANEMYNFIRTALKRLPQLNDELNDELDKIEDKQQVNLVKIRNLNESLKNSNSTSTSKEGQ